MRLEAAGLRLSAGDLSDFLACRHLTRNNLAVARGTLTPPRHQDAGYDALIARGQRHEAKVLAGFEARGWTVRELDSFANRHGGRRAANA